MQMMLNCFTLYNAIEKCERLYWVWGIYNNIL